MRTADLAVLLARTQAAYYIVTGVWPIIDIRSFEAITGPKADRWLVKTVGALVATTGAALGVASRQRRFPREVVLLAAGNAVVLAGVDIIYVAKRRISPIYLLDALPELALAVGWVAVWRQGPPGN